LGHTTGEIGHAIVDGPDFSSGIKALLTPANAHDFVREASLAKRKTDRPANQSYSDNGYRIVLGHVGILEGDGRLSEGATASVV
jgi:hypothetical protein